MRLGASYMRDLMVPLIRLSGIDLMTMSQTMLKTSVINVYRQISNISGSKSQKLNVSSLVLQNFVFAQSIEVKCYIENEDVVGEAPTGDAPTTSE